MASRVIVCLVVEKRNMGLCRAIWRRSGRQKPTRKWAPPVWAAFSPGWGNSQLGISTSLCLIEKVEDIKYPLGMLVINPHSLVCGSWCNFCFFFILQWKKTQKTTCTELGISVHPTKGVFLSDPSEAAAGGFYCLVFVFWIWWEREGEGDSWYFYSTD